MNKAKEAYTNALAKLEAPPAEKGKPIDITLAATAIFGTGLCEEELGNFDAAKKQYTEIISNPAYQYTTSIVEAKRRLDIMADFEKPVAFAPATNIPVQFQPAESAQPLSAGIEPNAAPVIPSAADVNLLKAAGSIETPVVNIVEPNKP